MSQLKNPVGQAVESVGAWLDSQGPVDLSASSMAAAGLVPSLGPVPVRAASSLPEKEVMEVRSLAGLCQQMQQDLPVEVLADLAQVIDLAVIDVLASNGMGQVMTYEQQCDAALVQNLIPRSGHETANSNAGRVEFGPHTDDAILEDPYRVDNLVLVGVDNPQHVPTSLIPLDGVLAQLSDADIEVLTQPRFMFAVPESFAIPGRDQLASIGRPVLSVSNRGFEVRLATYSTLACTGDVEAALVLERLVQAVHTAPRENVVLTPGKVLTFSNSRFLHGRGTVTGRRWVKRVYLKADLAALVADCPTDTPNVFDVEAAVRASIGSSR